MGSFFAQPAIPLEEINEGIFNLLNHGNGYTDVGVKRMTVAEMFWHIKRLTRKVGEEGEARRRAQLAAKAARGSVNNVASAAPFLGRH